MAAVAQRNGTEAPCVKRVKVPAASIVVVQSSTTTRRASRVLTVQMEMPCKFNRKRIVHRMAGACFRHICGYAIFQTSHEPPLEVRQSKLGTLRSSVVHRLLEEAWP